MSFPTTLTIIPLPLSFHPTFTIKLSPLFHFTPLAPQPLFPQYFFPLSHQQLSFPIPLHPISPNSQHQLSCPVPLHTPLTTNLFLHSSSPYSYHKTSIPIPLHPACSITPLTHFFCLYLTTNFLLLLLFIPLHPTLNLPALFHISGKGTAQN